MNFQHVIWRPLPYSMGVPIGSDWQDKPDTDEWRIYRECGFWTEAETQLLTQVAQQFKGKWLEIGAHTGWCTHALVCRSTGPYLCDDQGISVVAIEPMFSKWEWFERFCWNQAEYHENGPLDMGHIMPWAGRSDQYFATWDGGGGRTFDGALIDGDHAGGVPLADAKGVYDRLNPRGVVLLHDFRGPEVWDAAKYLVDRGMQFKVYPSVHMVCVCWRGDFTPPPVFHEGDVNWEKHYGLPGWAR